MKTTQPDTQGIEKHRIMPGSLPLKPGDIDEAWKIVNELCTQKFNRCLSIPVRDEDYDCVLARVIKAAAEYERGTHETSQLTTREGEAPDQATVLLKQALEALEDYGYTERTGLHISGMSDPDQIIQAIRKYLKIT